MKANFQINLPSIPGKNIKFKIQDIKSAAFGSQKARFPDNKAILTKKFVQSFHNFHQSQSQSQKDQTQTQPQSEPNRSFVKERQEVQFRSMISENKKFLLPIYSQLRKEESSRVEKSLEGNLLAKGGYTFNKAGLNVMSLEEEFEMAKQQERANNNASLTENYYFTNDGQEEEEEAVVVKKPRPNAVFKSQTRKVVYDRIYSSVVPGPGYYLKQNPTQKKSVEKAKVPKKQSKNGLKDYKHLKDVIAKVLVEQNQEEQEEVAEPKQLKKDHMFVLDDRDRFGNQIFPIAPKLKVPGPGSYQINDSMQDKAKKLILVQEQRKLLKQWFNN